MGLALKGLTKVLQFLHQRWLRNAGVKCGNFNEITVGVENKCGFSNFSILKFLIISHDTSVSCRESVVELKKTSFHSSMKSGRY